jgi:predicted outer membrane protein
MIMTTAMSRLVRLTLVAAVLGGAVACQDAESDAQSGDSANAARGADVVAAAPAATDDAPASGPIAGAPAPALIADGAPAPLPEAQILAVLFATAAGETRLAGLAPTRTTTPAVTDFADLMNEQASIATGRAVRLGFRLDLIPQDSDVGGKMAVDTTAAYAALACLTACAFDAAYLDAETATQARALAIIDQRMLTAVMNAELRAEVVSFRAEVQEHLTGAQAIAAGLVCAGEEGTGG